MAEHGLHFSQLLMYAIVTLARTAVYFVDVFCQKKSFSKVAARTALNSASVFAIFRKSVANALKLISQID